MNYKKIATISIILNILFLASVVVYQKLSVSEQQYVLVKTNYDKESRYRYNISSLPTYRPSADHSTGHKAYSMGYGVYRIIVYENATNFILLDLNVIVSERYTEITLTIKDNQVVGISA